KPHNLPWRRVEKARQARGSIGEFIVIHQTTFHVELPQTLVGESSQCIDWLLPEQVQVQIQFIQLPKGTCHCSLRTNNKAINALCFLQGPIQGIAMHQRMDRKRGAFSYAKSVLGKAARETLQFA